MTDLMLAPSKTISEEIVLDIEGLNISYFTRAGEIPAVIDFDLKLRKGEAVGLVGESGCGKSTVAMAIMRYMGRNGAIVGGAIRFKGRDMAEMDDEELRGLRGSSIAMIYQEPMAALNPTMSIGDQLIEVPKFHEPGISDAEARKRAIDMMGEVKIPEPERLFDCYPHQISGGQQQRVVIAMALLGNPDLLLLDEPTTALDVTVEAGIVELIAEISERFGTAMLYISHNLGLVLKTCDRVCVMYSGEVAEEGTIHQVFDAPRHPYTRGLFGCIATPGRDRRTSPLVAIPGQLPLPHQRPAGCNFGPRCEHFKPGVCAPNPVAVVPVPGEEFHKVRCARFDEITDKTPAIHVIDTEEPEQGEIVLNVDDMSKYYPVFDRSILAMLSGKSVRFVKANEAISFLAHKGETVAIVGESGCGKSTFAKVLMGLEQATEGTLTFNGDSIGGTPTDQRSASQLGAMQMVFQNPNDTLNPSITVGSQIGRVIRKFGVESDGSKVRERVFQLLDLVKLPRDFFYRRPRQLSGGQKQRVGIARAFAGNPKLVVADEPVSALDVSVSAAVTDLLMHIQREFGTTLLFISHDLGVVRYLADRIVVMYLGQIMEQGETEEIFSPPYHPYTEALLSAVPIADTSVDQARIVLEGNLPSPLNPPKGCPFSTRCPRRLGEICDNEPPPVHRSESGHEIRCHIPLEELRTIPPVIRQAPAVAAE